MMVFFLKDRKVQGKKETRFIENSWEFLKADSQKKRFLHVETFLIKLNSKK